jgi:hypothetical protein
VFFDAPWSSDIRNLSVSIGIGLLLFPFLAYLVSLKLKKRSRGKSLAAAVVVALISWGILGWTGSNTIRGYQVEEGRLKIQHLFRSHFHDLAGLRSAKFDPLAMQASTRKSATGGLFSYSGTFHNQGLGTYRAYVSDKSRCVVLRYSKQVLVVSPGDPQRFLVAIGNR